jgi:hypothetical protein
VLSPLLALCKLGRPESANETCVRTADGFKLAAELDRAISVSISFCMECGISRKDGAGERDDVPPADDRLEEEDDEVREMAYTVDLTFGMVRAVELVRRREALDATGGSPWCPWALTFRRCDTLSPKPSNRSMSIGSSAS